MVKTQKYQDLDINFESQDSQYLASALVTGISFVSAQIAWKASLSVKERYSYAFNVLERGFARAKTHQDVEAAINSFGKIIHGEEDTIPKCSNCNGTGMVNGDECSRCDGEGFLWT